MQRQKKEIFAKGISLEIQKKRKKNTRTLNTDIWTSMKIQMKKLVKCLFNLALLKR